VAGWNRGMGDADSGILSWYVWLNVRVPGCQKLQMTCCLIRSGTGCFIDVPIWQQWVSKG